MARTALALTDRPLAFNPSTIGIQQSGVDNARFGAPAAKDFRGEEGNIRGSADNLRWRKIDDDLVDPGAGGRFVGKGTKRRDNRKFQ
jgi:hypothetical protein